MVQRAELVSIRQCRHSWMELGLSAKNGKRYRRCENCGTIKEDTLPYIA